MKKLTLSPTLRTSELLAILRDHNWDDGEDLPHAIADHPNCDLGLALELFWLANADAVLLGEAQTDKYNETWRSFCTVITDRIKAGRYPRASTRFEVPLTKVQIYNYRKKGLPEVFLTNVEPTQA